MPSQDRDTQSTRTVAEEATVNIEGLGGAEVVTELQPLSGGAAGGCATSGRTSTPNTNSNSMSTSTLSVLDCLWDLLQNSPRLLMDNPQ